MKQNDPYEQLLAYVEGYCGGRDNPEFERMVRMEINNRLMLAPSITDGWKLVPIEPTVEAIKAMRKIMGYVGGFPNLGIIRASKLYGAVIDTAPNSPANKGWRPIETAPKDGTQFDVWTGEYRQTNVSFRATSVDKMPQLS